MKHFFLIIIAVVTSIVASAQLKGFSIGPYVEAAWPANDFKTRNGNAAGIGITTDINLPGRWSATGSAGYLHFRKLNDNTRTETTNEIVNALPLRAGLKYKLPLIYLKAEAGSARLLNGEASSLILSPGVGIRLLGLDIQGNYETWVSNKSTNFWSLRLAYHF